jgi:hypothetical protein
MHGQQGILHFPNTIHEKNLTDYQEFGYNLLGRRNFLFELSEGGKQVCYLALSHL